MKTPVPIRLLLLTAIQITALEHGLGKTEAPIGLLPSQKLAAPIDGDERNPFATVTYHW